MIYYYRMDPPLCSGGWSTVLGSPWLPPGKDISQCQRLVTRKGIIYLKSYTDLDNDLMPSLKMLKSFRIPTTTQSFLLPVAQSEVPYLRKRSRSPWFRQQLSSGIISCVAATISLIQNHVAPSHGLPARIFSPLFFQAKSLLLPKPHGKKRAPQSLMVLTFTKAMWS